MGVFDQLVRLGLPWVPRKLLWIVARRFVAGSKLSDGLKRVVDLRAAGFGTILDVLGEGQDEVAPAEAARTEYLRALEALPDVDPHTTISVKPTHIGLLHAEDLCERLLVELCEAAAVQGRRVRLEMESAETIDGTLAVFRRVRARHANLGCVLQSRLFRTAADVELLLADGPGLDVRLVKGIYLEPPEIAWTADEDICRSYRELAEALAGGGAFLSLATHHSELADACLEILGRAGRLDGPAQDRSYEFQLLMGVRRDEAQRLLAAGHPVRIYVPYGQDWYAYTQRRLQANPQIARHVLRALLTGR